MPVYDPFNSMRSNDSAEDGEEVTPTDSGTLGTISRLLYVGTAGTVRVRTKSQKVLNFTVPAGGQIPVKCDRVYATGTTATGIVALF